MVKVVQILSAQVYRSTAKILQYLARFVQDDLQKRTHFILTHTPLKCKYIYGTDLHQKHSQLKLGVIDLTEQKVRLSLLMSATDIISGMKLETLWGEGGGG